jgi:preprotein translocase subunit SecA
MLLDQVEELRKKNYNVDVVYNKNKEVNLDDQSL